MTFAAELWVQSYNWTGDYQLLAAAVSGLDYGQIQIMEVG